MKPTYTVIDFYFPATQKSKNKQTKNNYTNFSTLDEVKSHLLALAKKHKFTINVDELKDQWGSHRFGGMISKDNYADHCVTVEKGFLPKDIATALENKEIKFDTRGHNNVGFTKGESSAQEYFIKDFIDRHKRAVEGAKKLPDNHFALDKVYSPIAVGDTIEAECYCWDCDSRMRFLLIDEKTITLIDGSVYYGIRDKYCKNPNDRYEYKLTDLKLIPKCEALPFLKTRKMVSTINVPTGKIIFQNYFGKNDIIRDAPIGQEYNSPGLNSLLGRYKIMQYLASQDVGYGQMGNMSIGIYTNGKDEIIIGNSNWNYMLSSCQDTVNGEYGKIDSEQLIEYKKELKSLLAFQRILIKGNFKLKGEISLAVWRWMCADEQVYNNANITADKYDDVVKVKVQKGKYRIEHFYDMANEKNPLYSRLKKV